MTPRFARVVRNAGWTDTFDELLSLKLLQREHAAVVRKGRSLKRTGADIRNLTGMEAHAYRLACDDLLAWLHERGR